MYAKRSTVYATTEKMNLGTRYGSCSAASAFWLTQSYGDAVPFVLYTMPDVQSGWDALAELPFMETADDTGELMTDRLAQYGSYEYGRGGALSYLRGRSVSTGMYYVIVETPEGSFGRDRCGCFSA